MWMSSPRESERQLFVALKLAEVCNIKCDYCYFFEKHDQSHVDAPAYMAMPTVEAAGQFLAKGARDLGLTSIDIALHGGEPLLLGKKRIADVCRILHREIDPYVKLNLGVQTNGMLLDREWVELLASLGCRIGVSLDGPRHIHDRFRKDKAGRGTFDRVMTAIALLQTCKTDGLIGSFGIISVINKDLSAADAYQFFVRDMHLKRLYFRLPTLTWDDVGNGVPEEFQKFLVEIFELWVRDDDPSVHIRPNIEVLQPLIHDRPSGLWVDYLINLTQAISIRSNGDLCPDDSLPPVSPQFRTLGHNIKTHTLAEFYRTPIWDEIRDSLLTLPSDCTECRWLGLCGGGPTATRYRQGRGLSQKSVFCDIYKATFEKGLDYANRHLPNRVTEARLANAAGSLKSLHLNEASAR
jgi:uncharacterized protein